MNAPQEFLVPPTAALRRLADFLRQSGSSLKPGEVAEQAINQWIARAQGLPTPGIAPARGYQWKSLFLPEGSQLRMRFGDHSYYARVEGDAVVYGGQRLSPRQMAIAIAGGGGHNAWREFSILLPGESKWRPASLLRRESERQAPATTASPAEAMAAAAACMTETLQTALALVEHANAQALPKYERRVERQRRAQDLATQACQFD